MASPVPGGHTQHPPSTPPVWMLKQMNLNMKPFKNSSATWNPRGSVQYKFLKVTPPHPLSICTSPNQLSLHMKKEKSFLFLLKRKWVTGSSTFKSQALKSQRKQVFWQRTRGGPLGLLWCSDPGGSLPIGQMEPQACFLAKARPGGVSLSSPKWYCNPSPLAPQCRINNQK